MPTRLFIADMDRILVPAFLVTDPEAGDYKQWKREHPDSFRVPCRWVWRDSNGREIVQTAQREDPLADPKPRRRSNEDEAVPPVIPVIPPAGPHLTPFFLPRAPSVAPSGPARVAPGGRGGGPAASPPRMEPGGAGDVDPATPEERVRLRTALERAGSIAPGQDAHHIVPGGGAMYGGRDPARSQQLLREAGIGLDGPSNGLPLSPEFHRRLHTAAYCRYVEEQLRLANGPEEVRAVLSRLAARIKLAEAVSTHRPSALLAGMKP